ncbi:MAG: DUF3857 domain-containing protein [Erythrobacter sp.]|jgi:hypothetical protein|nr:DUF3857 domain-containing protein [Erythrobacter sp.]
MMRSLPPVLLAAAFFVPASPCLAEAAPAARQEATGSGEIAIAPVPDWASPSEMLAVPDDAQGLIFVRRQDIIMRLTEDGQYNHVSQVFRILQPEALQAGNLGITWNPASGQPRVHSLLIRRGSRVIDVLEQARFEVLRREDQLEQAKLDGMLIAVLQVPDLRVGDDLELSYTVPLHDPTLRETSHGMLFLGDSTPSGRYRLELNWEEGQEPVIRPSDDFAPLVEREPGRLRLELDNPAIVVPPKDAPPRYAWTRIIEFSDFKDWPAVSRRFHALFGEARRLSPGSALREEARYIAEAHPGDRLAQAQAALELVQQQVRYIYIGLNGGNFTPAGAEETWARRYGDCKGKTAMLLALLDSLEIEAEPVLVSNSTTTDGLDARLPSPGHFDHVLVRARIADEDHWLDGTLPAVIEGRPDPFFRYEWILPLSEKGSELEQRGFRPFDLPQEMQVIEIDARAGFDAPARRVETTLLRGPAGLQQHIAFSAVTQSQIEAALRSRLVGSDSWDSIESVEYRFDKATRASVLTISGTGPVDWDDEGGGAHSLVLPGGGFSPPPRRQRATEEDGAVPFYNNADYSCHVTTVRLPEDTPLENWGFNSTYDTMMFGTLYYRMMERRGDRTIRMQRTRRVEMNEITVERAERDNARLADFDDSTARIGYDPEVLMESWGDLRPVPASWEIDWTGADAPCLPPDLTDDGDDGRG